MFAFCERGEEAGSGSAFFFSLHVFFLFLSLDITLSFVLYNYIIVANFSSGFGIGNSGRDER